MTARFGQRAGLVPVRVTWNGITRTVLCEPGVPARRLVQRARDRDAFGIAGGPALALFTAGGRELGDAEPVWSGADLILRPAVLH